MAMNYALMIMSGLLLSACSMMLSSEARSVEVYHLKMRLPEGCQKLGDLEASAQSMIDESSALSEAMDDLRQQAYDTYQANTLYISETGNDFVSVNHQAFAKGTAYNCPK